MAYTRSKKQFAAIVARAAELRAGGLSYRACRDMLVEEFGCHPSTAHRAYHRAASGGDNWGGRREGAGRPAEQGPT
jgi:hypothetical protein